VQAERHAASCMTVHDLQRLSSLMKGNQDFLWCLACFVSMLSVLCMAQAIARSHRIGQTKEVRVIHFEAVADAVEPSVSQHAQQEDCQVRMQLNPSALHV